MKRLIILLTGASLVASGAIAGSVSGIAGTLDITAVDPAPTAYPHFICASGCAGGGSSSVTQSGVWSVGISNFPTLQTVTGTVSVAGGAIAASQPALNVDGGSLNHVTNFPSVQSISGVVSVGNFPATQAVSGSVAVSNLPASQAVTGTVSVGNFPATQAVSGSVAVTGVATAANQVAQMAAEQVIANAANLPVPCAVTTTAPAYPNASTQAISCNIAGATRVDGSGVTQPISGSVSIANFPSAQPVSGTVSVGNFPATQPVSGSISVGNFPATQPVSGAVTANLGTLNGAAAAANQQTNNLFYTGTTTALTASATYTGANRDIGVAAGSGQPYSYFNGIYITDQAGTAYIDGSNDGTTFYIVATAPVVGGTPLILTVPVLFRYHRTRLVNGTTAETSLVVNNAYTAS